MELIIFEKPDYKQLIDWIDSKDLNYLWGGPSYDFPLTHQQIKHHCAQECVFPYLAKHEGQNVGFIELYQVSMSEFHVCRVFISSEFRGQGLAQEMMRLATQKAALEFNANLLTLYVFSHNESAIKCYEKLGFKTTSVQARERVLGGKVWELRAMEKRL